MHNTYQYGDLVRIVSDTSEFRGEKGLVRTHSREGFAYDKSRVCVELDLVPDPLRVFLSPASVVLVKSSSPHKNSSDSSDNKPQVSVNKVKTVNISITDPQLVDALQEFAQQRVDAPAVPVSNDGKSEKLQEFWRKLAEY